MPDVLVEVSGSWLDGQQAEFLHAVHDAMVAALHTPVDEPVVRLITHPPGCFLIPDAAGERYTRIEIVLFRGRSLQVKRELYRSMAMGLADFEVPPEDVKVVLVEVPPQDVGFRGGRAACDVDLGYTIDV